MNPVEGTDLQIGIVKEDSWSDAPANPAFQLLKTSGEGLEASAESTTSANINKRGGITSRAKTGGGSGGDFNMDLSLGDDIKILLAQALRGSFDAETLILKAANDKQSCLIEKQFDTDGGNKLFFRYPGFRCGNLALQATQDQAVKLTFGGQAKAEDTATAAIAGATYSDANGNRELTSADIREMYISSVNGEIIFTDIQLTVNNNLRQQRGMSNQVKIGDPADRDAKGIGMGMRDVTGSIEAMLTDLELYTVVSGDDDVSFTFVIVGDHEAWSVTLPKVMFSGRNAQANDGNSDAGQRLTFGASIDDNIDTDLIVFTGAGRPVALTVTDGASPAISVGGDYMLTSGTKGNADAVYVRKDGMFVLRQDGGNFTFLQTGGKKFFTGGADVEAVYTAVAGFEGDVPTVALA